MKAVIFVHVLQLVLMKTVVVEGVTKCESKVELRAVLLSCPTKDSGCEDDDPLSQAMAAEEAQLFQMNPKNFRSMKDEKERGFPNAVKDCKRKIIITLKVKNSGKIPCDDEYIVVDHVFDPITGGRGRLLTPIVLKLRLEQMIQLYGLQFQRVVNSQPFEEQKSSKKECSADKENSTCGITTYDGKPLPFSEGFCCSCNPEVNLKRQISAVPQGDSFLYRDSKLISHKSSRFSRLGTTPEDDDNKSAGKSKKESTSSKDNDDKDDKCPIKGISPEKLPNYLMEHDRKIICGKEDFLSELCKLRDEKNKEQAEEYGKHESTKKLSSNQRGPLVSDVNKGDSIGHQNILDSTKLELAGTVPHLNFVGNIYDENVKANSNGISNAIILKSLIGALSMDETTKSDHHSEKDNHVTRGKRENLQEPFIYKTAKKASLEEKLDEFANVKNILGSRRKRLLELPHRRFQKMDTDCKDEQKWPVVAAEYSKDNAGYVPPPKYFFSHDKHILYPMEPSGVRNTSCKSSDDADYEDSANNGEGKCQKFSNTNELSRYNNYNKVGQKMQNDEVSIKSTAAESMSGNKEKNKMRFEKKFSNENLKTKSERIKENGDSLKNDRRNKIDHAINEKKQDEEESECNRGNGEKGREKLNDDTRKEVEKINFDGKNLKNFLLRGDEEKSLSKLKMKNSLFAKSRERQKLLPQAKYHNEPETDVKGNLCKNKYEKFLTEEGKDGSNDGSFDEKKNRIFEKDRKDEDERRIVDANRPGYKKLKSQTENHDLKEPFDDRENLLGNIKHKQQFNKNRGNIDFSQGKIFEESRRLYKPSLGIASEAKRNRMYLPNRSMGRQPGNVDFNFEIIRRQYPEFSNINMHSSKIKDPFNVRLETQRNNLEAKNYPTNGNRYVGEVIMKSRQHPLLVYKSPQKYYIVDNTNKDNSFPQVNYNIQKNLDFPAEVQNRVYIKDAKSIHRDFVVPDTRYRSQSQNYGTYLPQMPYGRYKVPDTDYGFYKKKYSNAQKGKMRRQNLLHNIRESTSFAMKEVPGDDGGSRFCPMEKSRNSNSALFRSKRAAENPFEPAKRYLRSEVESTKKYSDSSELGMCSREGKIRTSENDEHWPDVNSGPFKLSFNMELRSDMVSAESKLNYRKNRSKNTRYEENGKAISDKERLIRSYRNAPDYVMKKFEAGLKGKREANDDPAEGLSRMNENCKKETPDGEYTPESAHCMRFGDLWYSVYLIKKPVVAQIVGIQLFDKHSLCDGSTQWRDLTKGKMVRLGTFLPKAEDELPTISMTYMGGKTKKIESAIDPDNYLLLIPSHLSDPSKASCNPQVEGGPEEYLVVESKDVSSGKDCDMIGTSFEAFARQPDRCSRPVGSCLKRQPADLWREDMEARIRGKRGKYFVENFGTVPNSPIKTYTNFTGEFLALEYYGDYTSTIEIELKADFNAMVRKGSVAQIPAVYIDGTYPKKTRIILSVLNIGLTAAYFRPRLGDCPPDLDPAWCPLEGPLVTIPPHQRHDFRLDLSGALPPNKIHVTVQVLNQMNKKVAYRKIIIKKGDRCICAFHCKCNCIGNVDGRTCHKLNIEDYRGAGYIGSFPFRGGAAATASESVRGNLKVIFLVATYVLFFMGVIKAVLGIFFRRVGIAGTRVIVGPRRLNSYYEYELECCSVLFDECGFPVHPTTCQPVQIVPLWLEILINILFFFLYPLRGIWFLILSLPCCSIAIEFCDGCSRNEEDSFDYDQKPLLSKNSHPTCINYNLTTHKIKQGKPDEYLSYLPYKGDDDPLEEDDTEFVLQEMKRYRKKVALL